MCVPGVEIEHYSVAYFNSLTVFDAHMHCIEVSGIYACMLCI